MVNTCPLISLANDVQPTVDMAIITVYMPGGNITDMAMARRSDGKERIKSTTDMSTVSSLPPKYPEAIPIPKPIRADTNAATIATPMDTLPP